MKALVTKNARRRFTVARDVHGVPHISAMTWREALYGLGYMHAIDRPTQMLFSRAVASGHAAELIADKPELLEMDRFFRRAGLDLNSQTEVGSLDDSTFDQLTAYCEGVNDGMKDAGRSLPMWATGFVPQPWNQRSVLLMGNLLSFGGLAVGQQQNERMLFDLIHAGVDDDKLRELFSPLLDGADFDLLRQVQTASQLSDEALELITDLPRLAGSNAWAVSPGRTTNGSALIASDPHLEVNRLPAIWYEAVLHWGNDDYVLGATLPGCPLFAVARTHNVSWGVTYLKGDTSDYFIEDCRPGGSTGWQYRRGEQWHDFEVRHERLGPQRATGPRPFPSFSIHRARSRASPKADAPGYYLSTSWIGDQLGAGRSIATWLEVIGATIGRRGHGHRSRVPAADAVLGVSPIARGTSACRPTAGFRGGRASTTGCMPIPAWDEQNHWQGKLPASCCRASTIRRKDSWLRPTKTSIPPADRCWSRNPCPTIASGGSTNGLPS